MKMPARFSVPVPFAAGAALGVAPLGADHLARPRGDRGELDAVLLVRLLDARSLEMLEDHRAEVLRLAVCAGRRLGHAVDELVVLVDAEDAVGREALDRERPGDAHLAVVGVGLVVEVLEVRLRGDRGVDLTLARDALLPPLFVQRPRLGRPPLLGLLRDLPFRPRLAEHRVQLLAQRIEGALELLPDDVDLGVVGDVAELNVGQALVDEALADVAVG